MKLSFEVQNIPTDGMEAEGSLTFEDLNLKYEGVKPSGPIDYKLFLNVVSGEFIATGRVDLNVRVNCSRCLKEIEKEIEIGDFSFTDAIDNRKIIDLTDRVREDIIFALPIKPLCDKECKGICPRCGKNLNTGSCSCEPPVDDTRWGDLDKLNPPPKVKPHSRNGK